MSLLARRVGPDGIYEDGEATAIDVQTTPPALEDILIVCTDFVTGSAADGLRDAIERGAGRVLETSAEIEAFARSVTP